MYDLLPKDFGVAGQIILDSFCREIEGVSLTGENVFFYMPHGVYVSRYGLEEAHFELATTFIYEMTKRFSAEFAIRPFLEKYPEKMLQKLQLWVKDDNQHVRRLVSEGSRPRLPWASRVTAFDNNYSIILDLLDQLKNDPELYVRRSVANHLNDLTKDRAPIVLNLLSRWNKKATKDTQWITKHALRTLIKAGNKGTLALLGYNDNIQIEVANFELDSTNLNVGEKLTFSFDIISKSKETQALVVDYIIYFVKSNGTQSPKVFKLKNISLEGNTTITIQKKQLFQHFSTRVLYEGQHAIELQINGQSFGKKDFNLKI
jgi:3-methyladenine DNA glycosylase AlkC